MEIAKGVNADFEQGNVILTIHVADQVQPILDKFKDEVSTGKVDLVAGTDLDKYIVLQAIAFLETWLKK